MGLSFIMQTPITCNLTQEVVLMTYLFTREVDIVTLILLRQAVVQTDPKALFTPTYPESILVKSSNDLKDKKAGEIEKNKTKQNKNRANKETCNGNA